MDTPNPPNPRTVLLVTSATPPHLHDHTTVLANAGFKVLNHPYDEASIGDVIRLEPHIIVAELDNGASEGMFNFVRRLKADPIARDIPIIVYGVGLTADEIEKTAHAGAMWLQLEPKDGFKLLGAIRGVLRARAA